MDVIAVGGPDPLVRAAAALARAAHAGQIDKAGRPYFDAHVLDVHRRVAAAGYGPAHQAAALLHDVVEDTAVDLTALAEAGMPPEVVTAVAAVTRRPGERYLDMVARAAADPIGRVVKAADNLSNCDPARVALLRETDPARADSLASRYARAREVLRADGPVPGLLD